VKTSDPHRSRRSPPHAGPPAAGDPSGDRPQPMRRLVWPLLAGLYAIFLWRTPYSQKAFPLTILDWAVPVAGLGAWLLARWRRHEGWPTTPLDLPLLAWLAVCLLSVAFSIDPRSSLQRLWEALLWALILWMLVDTIRRGRGGLLWQAGYLVAGVVCLLAIVEFLAWYFGWPLLSAFQQGWPAIGGSAGLIPPILYRLSFTLVHSTVLSAFFALMIPPAICTLVATRQRDIRVGMLLWLAAAAVIEFLSLSRGGFLALGVSLPILVLGAAFSPQFRGWLSRLPRQRVRVLFGGMILIALVVVAAVGFLLAARLAQHGSGDSVRLDLWQSAIHMVRDHPLTGVGLAAYGEALRSYRDPLLARDQISTAHNLYLHTAAELGLPGVLASVWLLLALVKAWRRRWRATAAGTAPQRSPSGGWWRILGIGAALAGLAAQLLAETYVEPAILLPAIFFAAQILAPQPGREKPHAGPQPRAALHVTAEVRSRRWIWATALALLAAGAAGMAWDTWGQARYVQSVAWAQRNDIEQALFAAERARDHDPGMPLYSCHAGYLYGLQAAEGDRASLTTALERYGECMDKIRVPGWLDQLNRSALLWQADKKTGARNTVRQATAQTPLEWMPWLNEGYWAEIEGDRAEAIDSYGWVLALDPELAGSPFWRSGERMGWWNDIIAAGEDAVELLGRDPTHLWRWQVALAAGQPEAAAEGIEAWLGSHPTDPEAMAWLGEALLNLDRADEALVWLSHALSLDPSRARSYLVRGEAELALGHYDDAERDLRTALFLEPDYPVHLALARLAHSTGDEQTALKEYAQALRPLTVLQSYAVVLYHRMGWVALLPQALRIGYRQDGEAAAEWAALLQQRGDLASARQVYAAALALDPYIEIAQDLPGGENP